ncbi:FecR domain-containing protein [uncultured Sunxiuqinia sp.]|uniref:FecR family protein n=1 Tax=uncultured Sunxiuqinia sp. TaxID=1573825 RepID=UPI00261F7607|nr:FecR domain-containing protein [uncultured Sunxiuqinia sp.]
MTSKKKNTLALFDEIVDFMKKQEATTDIDEKKHLWNKIILTAAFKRRQRRARIYASLTTAAAVFVGLMVWIEPASRFEDDTKLNMVFSEVSIPKQASDIILMVSDSNEIRIDKDTAVVNFSEKGKITVNSKAIATQSSSKGMEEKYNQIIVPGGKRTMLTLSDSTKIWINAGTRVIFPKEFKGVKRKIFVDGEAYLEVARNTEKPFIVETPAQFEIEVLGTSFNVCTYDELEFATVVLAHGSVEIKGVGRQKRIMSPNQLVRIDEKGVLDETISVNAEDYTSWTKGIMVLNSRPFSEVVKTLQIYFGVSLEVDQSLDEIISGQLALKDNFDEVLSGLQHIVAFTYSKDQNGIYKIEKH